MVKFDILRVSRQLTEELKLQGLQPPVSGAEVASRSSIIENGGYKALGSPLLDSWGHVDCEPGISYGFEQLLLCRPVSLRSECAIGCMNWVSEFP